MPATLRRGAAERRRAAEHAVTLALAESTNLEDAAGKVLQTVGELGLRPGRAFGSGPGRRGNPGAWRSGIPGLAVTEFEQHSRRITFARGEGLPGRAGTPAGLGPGCTLSPLRGGAAERAVRRPRLPPAKQRQHPRRHRVLQPRAPATPGSRAGHDGEHGHPGWPVHRAPAGGKGVARAARSFDSRARFSNDCSLMPRPPWPASRSRALCLPAQETGGDYFDFISMPDGLQGIAVGDAGGHGIGAALAHGETRVPARSHSPIRTPAPSSASSTLASWRTSAAITSSPFSSPDSVPPRPLVYSNAGHWPGYVLDARGEVKLVLDSTSMP